MHFVFVEFLGFWIHLNFSLFCISILRLFLLLFLAGAGYICGSRLFWHTYDTAFEMSDKLKKKREWKVENQWICQKLFVVLKNRNWFCTITITIISGYTKNELLFSHSIELLKTSHSVFFLFFLIGLKFYLFSKI